MLLAGETEVVGLRRVWNRFLRPGVPSMGEIFFMLQTGVKKALFQGSSPPGVASGQVLEVMPRGVGIYPPPPRNQHEPNNDL